MGGLAKAVTAFLCSQIANTSGKHACASFCWRLARCDSLGLSYTDLIELGQQCKRLLDVGRIQKLEALGFRCKLLVSWLQVDIGVVD